MRRMTLGLTGLAVLAGCAGAAAPGAGSGAESGGAPGEAPDAVEPGDGPPGDRALTRATERLVAFLRGDAPLDTLLLADTITLHVAPEGGGDSVRVARGALGDRGRWRVGTHTLVPPEGLDWRAASRRGA